MGERTFEIKVSRDRGPGQVGDHREGPRDETLRGGSTGRLSGRPKAGVPPDGEDNLGAARHKHRARIRPPLRQKVTESIREGPRQHEGGVREAVLDGVRYESIAEPPF